MYYLSKGRERDEVEAEHRRESASRARVHLSEERPIQKVRASMAVILVPIDGSTKTDSGVRHVIRLSTHGMAMKVHLLNVQGEWAALRSEYEKREGAALHVLAANNATRSARALLTAAGVDFESHLRIGEPADEIVRLAREMRCHEIVMATRRLGTLPGLILGSVAKKVIRGATLPVTLVKEA